ncbi:TldD/PmbA family protein [candidate division KSB1 bacterium]|nr:TldD/PmbA family protein [candidate division KSB1 bacterium]MBL7092616.1 TldD/PmbA family protein [candidate division KSB1 bacterium]
MSKMEKNIVELAESLVEYTTKKGADEVEVHIGQGWGFSVDVRNGEIEKLEEAGDKQIFIRLIKDKKTAIVDSSDFNKDTLYHLIINAIKRAEFSSPDPYAGLPEFDKSIEMADWKKLNIYDPSMDELSPEKKIEFAREIEKICLADQRISNSYGATFYDSSSETILVNSYGFCGTYKRTSCGAGVHLQAGGINNKVEAGWYDNSCYFKNLWQPEKIAQKAIHRVTRLMNPKKVKTQNVPVVLEPGVTRTILGFLYQCINGKAIYMKQSFLLDKIGESITSKGITIIDDGLLPGASGTKPFDEEGVPVRKNVVVDNGILKTYLTDEYSGRKLSVKSTGNASGANNFYLKNGNYEPEEMIKSVDNGLLLTGTMGQGTNAATGDFSKGVSGLWIENGEVIFPVAEAAVSGNLAQMLKDIVMVGNDLRFDRSITGPTVKIGEMTVSGL